MTTGQEHGELWSRGARDWATFQEPHFHPFYKTVHDRLKIGQGTRLLDVGCGPGGAALLATERGAQVSGLDASPGSIAMARERLPEGDFRVGDMESLPWEDDTFDVVTGFNSIQFAGDPLQALRAVQRVLVSGGRLGMVIWAPREQSQQSRLMDAISALAPPRSPDVPGPFALSGPGVLESVLKDAGLREIDGGDVPVEFRYPDATAACGAISAGSAATRAAQHVGTEVVRQAILEALQEFRVATGGFCIKNRFRFVIAKSA